MQPEPTGITRIIVIVQDRVGTLAGITATLAQGGVNLDSLNTESQGQNGCVIITTDQTDRALALLNQAGYKAVCDDTALIVQIPDQPGAISRLVAGIREAGADLRTLNIIHRHQGRVTITLTTDDPQAARAAVRDYDII